MRYRKTSTGFAIEAGQDGAQPGPAVSFPRTTLADVAGSLKASRKLAPRLTDRAAVESEIKRRQRRGRY